MKRIIRTYRPAPLRIESHGFTIVELMIASLIFAVILLSIAAGVIKFTSDFYRGVNASTTQNVAANIISTVSQAFQFSSASGGDAGNAATIDGGTYICAGSKEFVYYSFGAEEPGGSPAAGLFVFTPRSGCSNRPQSDAGWATRQDLLQPHTRLTRLSADNSADDATWNIEVGVAYGDAPLMCDSSMDGSTGGCRPADGEFTETTLAADIRSSDSITTDLKCKALSGSQFCSVVNLSTTVQARL